MGNENLKQWQQMIATSADELCVELFDWCEGMDLNPEIALHSIPIAAAYFFVSVVKSCHEKKLLDEIIRSHIEYFGLVLRKRAALDIPTRLSDEFRLETAWMDREIKRRRQTPNAVDGGEA